MSKLRRYFIAGLVVVLPMLLTVYLLIAIFDFMDGILGKYINNLTIRYLGSYIPGLGLILFLIFIIIVGFFATKFIGRLFIPIFDKFFLNFPLSRLIYPAAKQIVNFLFSHKKFNFKKVVLIEYPRKGIYSIGFITNEGFKEACQKTNQELVNVFVANSPTPLSGYFMLLPKKDIIILDISVEEGLKLIVSGGVINPAKA